MFKTQVEPKVVSLQSFEHFYIISVVINPLSPNSD